jgi:hypothetical protein
MILNNNPGEPYEYGCVMTFIPKAKEVMERMVFPLEPLKQKIMGFQMYRGIYGGLFWIYVVSSHSEQFPHKEVFVSKEGNVSIYQAPPTAEEFIIDLGKDMSEILKRVRSGNA